MSRIPELVEEMRRIAALPIEDDSSDDDFSITVLPPASESALAAFKRACGGSLPVDLEEFLRLTAGVESVDLEWQPKPDALEVHGSGHLLRASHCGNGDGFAIEPAGDQCRVWWMGHDPWFMIYWAPSIETFLEIWIQKARANREDPGAPAWKPSRRSSLAKADMWDVDLQRFFDELPRGSVIHDLRSAAPGTEVPYARLELLVRGGRMRRSGLLLGFSPPPPPRAIEAYPISTYESEVLDERERAILRALPKGTLVLHERDIPPGGYLDTRAYEGHEMTRRPPFEIVFPKKSRSFW